MGVLSFFLSPGNWSFGECGGGGGGDHALNEEEVPQSVCWLRGFSSPLHNEGQQIWLVGRPILTNPKKNNFALCKQFGFCCCCCCFGFMHLKFDILWGDKYTTAPKLLWRFLNYGYILGLFLQIVKKWNIFLWHVVHPRLFPLALIPYLLQTLQRSSNNHKDGVLLCVGFRVIPNPAPTYSQLWSKL